MMDAALGINESGGLGQIGLSGTISIGGILQTWCIDVAHYSQSAGSFTTGTFLSGNLGTSINALITNGTSLLGGDSNACAALQVAIWKVEYGSGVDGHRTLRRPGFGQHLHRQRRPGRHINDRRPG